MPGILRVDQANVDFIYAKTTGGTVYVPGHIIQVVNTYFTTPISQTVTAGYNVYNDIPGMSATITPKSASSKIYMTVRWFGEFGDQTPAWNSMWNIKRNGTPIGLPAQPGTLNLGITISALSYYANDGNSTPESAFFDYYDSPASTSSLTYQLSITTTIAHTLCTNRTINAGTSGDLERGTSSITLFEIAG